MTLAGLAGLLRPLDWAALAVGSVLALNPRFSPTIRGAGAVLLLVEAYRFRPVPGGNIGVTFNTGGGDWADPGAVNPELDNDTTF